MIVEDIKIINEQIVKKPLSSFTFPSSAPCCGAMGVSIASLSGTNDKSAMTETDALVVADWLVIVTDSLEAVAQRCHHLVAVVAHLGGSYDAVVFGVGVTVVAHEGVEVTIGMAVLVCQVEVDVLAGLETQT